jgi:hypothetical protein
MSDTLHPCRIDLQPLPPPATYRELARLHDQALDTHRFREYLEPLPRLLEVRGHRINMAPSVDGPQPQKLAEPDDSG